MVLSIIIVSYNATCFLEQCLCSVRAAIRNIDAEVIVIDNCSSGNPIAYLTPQFPHVKFVQNESNEGFAKANNKALQMASGKYILFVNPDTILAEDTLERCIFFYENNANVGAVGVRMLDGSGKFLPESKRSFPSPVVSFYKLTGLSSLFPFSKQFGRYALGYLPENAVHEVDVISGAFMMIPKIILDTTGGFDEQFFMYAEDIDLSYRVQKSGYRNIYLGNISIVHFKGESTKKSSLNYVKVFYKAMSLFVKKWYRGAGSLLLQQFLQAGIWVRGAASAIHLSFTKKAKQQDDFKEILLVGNATQASLAAAIVHSYYPDKKTTTITEFTNGITINADSLVVFCIGDLSYQQSIEILQQHKAGFYHWFGKGSQSIVGSYSKNEMGEVLLRK